MLTWASVRECHQTDATVSSEERRGGCRRFRLRPRMGVLGINHLAFRTPDPDRLRRFYLELTGAEELDGEHRPLRLGQTLIAFFPSKSPGAAADPDEIAFDVDGPGFADVLERARRLGCQIRGPLEHTSSSQGFYLSDPDGRRLNSRTMTAAVTGASSGSLLA